MTELEDKTREILQMWVSTNGHDRCWWHPELLTELGKLYGVDMSVATNNLSLDTFKRGCRLYQSIEYKLPIPDDCKDIKL